MANAVIFGSDTEANDYNDAWTRTWLDRDNAIFDEIGLAPAARAGVFSENVLRFIGASTTEVEHRIPLPGQGEGGEGGCAH